MSQREKIRHLEGLRGIAAFIVLLGHLKLCAFITHQHYVHSLIYEMKVNVFFKLVLINTSNLFVDGELAVWIFWVLSSYVISILFFKENENCDKVLIAYSTKRYLRLLIPVLASVLFAYVLIKLGCMHNKELASVLGPPYFSGWLDLYYNFEANFSSAVSSAFYSTFFDFSAKTTYNPVLWTIQNEFLGSLFTFSLFGIIRHNGKRHFLYLIVLLVLLKLNFIWLTAFAVGHVLCDYDNSISTNQLLNRLRDFEYRLHSFKRINLLLSAAFIIYFHQITTVINIPGEYRKFILSVVIVYVCTRNNFYKKFLSTPIFLWLGKISFGLYLLHLPLIFSLTCYLILNNNSLQGKIIASLTTILVTLLLSHFFTKYIDKMGIMYANKVGDYFKKYS